MSRALKLADQRFGDLIAIAPHHTEASGAMVWECKCDCGATAMVRASNLSSGRQTSCGHCGINRGKARALSVTIHCAPDTLGGNPILRGFAVARDGFGEVVAIRPYDWRNVDRRERLNPLLLRMLGILHEAGRIKARGANQSTLQWVRSTKLNVTIDMRPDPEQVKAIYRSLGGVLPEDKPREYKLADIDVPPIPLESAPLPQAAADLFASWASDDDSEVDQ